MRKSLITTAVLGALAVPSFVFAADAAPAPDLTVAYNIGLYSQYIFRGLTQTDRGPAVQGGVDLTHSSGFYLGAWASNISWLRDLNPGAGQVAYEKGGHLELDLYGGYRYAFANGIANLPANLPAFRHIGIYAYRARFLSAYAGLAPAAVEQVEALEQLRALWHGYRICVMVTEDAPHAGVDTPADLEHVRKLIRAA